MALVMGRFGRRVGLVAVLRATSVLGLSVGAILPTAAVAQTFQFSNVQVTGNERVATDRILGLAQVPTGQSLTAGELNAAYQRLAGAGLFETVEIVPRGGTLQIDVAEYPVVNRISIEGNSRLSDEELLELIDLVPRRVYNPAQAEADAASIAEAYEPRGRLAATVNPRIIRRGNNSVDLIFEVAEGGVVEVERLSFVGNRAFSDRRLRRVLETRQAGLLRQFIQSDTYVTERVAYDQQLLRDFYTSRGYIDFRIQNVSSEFARERDAFFLQFTVEEGQRWEFGNITASSPIAGIDARDYARVADIRSGANYAPQAIQNAVARMERLATQRGLNFVRATPQVERNPRTLTLDINFVIERGERIFVERIDIEGNSTTLDRVIRREFTSVEGDPFNPREIQAAAERIRALNYFSNVNVEGRPGTSEDQVIVDVDVDEQPTGSLSFGGSYSTDNGIGLNVSFSERNFLGRGQTLNLGVTTGTDANAANFTFVEPAFLSRDLSFRFNADYSTTDYDNANYDTETIAFSPSIEFPVSENGRLALRYRIARDQLELNDDEDDNDNISPILRENEEEILTSAVGYTYTFDNRRTGLDPETGYLLSFGQDLAGLGGDAKYIRTVARGVAQTQVRNDEVTLQATVEGGAVNAIDDYETRVTDRFFLNSRQLRGFEPLGVGPRDLETDDALGGNYFASARFEANFPLSLPEEYGVSGGVFFDAGSVWGLDDTEGLNGVEVDDSFSLRTAVGVSLFWTTPLGPLRFNFAEALRQEDYDDTRVFNVSVSTQF